MSKAKQMYIGGQWVDAEGGATFDVMNPATGDTCHAVADGSRTDTQKAIAAAAAAQPAWAATPHSERARIVHRVGDLLEARAKDFQEALIDEGGSWIGKAMFETGYSSR
jgi:acyl-CoA reductase-like NAD-dependent aldehyde dehydrogenase